MSKKAWRIKDEIEHEFRPKNNESTDYITPMIFTGAIGFCLLVVLVLISKAGGNLSYLFKPSSLGVLISFGCLTSTFVLFWTSIRIIPGIGLLSASLVLAVVFIRSGSKQKQD